MSDGAIHFSIGRIVKEMPGTGTISDHTSRSSTVFESTSEEGGTDMGISDFSSNRIRQSEFDSQNLSLSLQVHHSTLCASLWLRVGQND